MVWWRLNRVVETNIIQMKSNILRAATVVATFHFPLVVGSLFTISDERVRSLDVAPMLCRIYSVGMNNFRLNCHNVSEIITPSYNYGCKYFISHLFFGKLSYLCTTANIFCCQLKKKLTLFLL